MDKNQIPVVKQSLFSWVFSGKINLQVLLIVIILAAVFARVLPLEMQKRVVNEAIKLKKIDLLLFYCGIYLVAVVSANGLKYLINILQTVIGQRAGADMRKGLYHHILTLPLSFFRRTQPGMVVSSLVNELATAGDFVGQAVAVPLSNALTLLAIAGYLLWLNPLLAVVSFSIYPLGLFLVTRLQKLANRANSQRVDQARQVSSKIAESMTGIQEIQANGAFRIENRKFDTLVDQLMKTRIVWNLYRFGIKVSNNVSTSISQFLIFIIGGYLAINGRLELGALVAFLSAQERLYDPWRELVDFYQDYQDASVSYYRTMDYFNVQPEHKLEPEDRNPYELDGSIEVKDLSFATETGIKLLDDIHFSLKPGQRLGLVGFSGSGKSTLAQCIGQLYKYTGGQIRIGNQDVSGLTKKDIAYNIGFVSQTPFIFDGTFQENLLYSVLVKVDGNGTGEIPSLDDMINVIQQTGLFTDVLRFGLNAVLDVERYENLVPHLIRVRKKLSRRLKISLAEYVEVFDKGVYLYYSSVAKNLTFGFSMDKEFRERKLFANRFFLQFLGDNGLTPPLLNLGAELCKRTVDILIPLPPDETFFEQSPIAAEELGEYKSIAERIKESDLDRLAAQDRQMLLKLALRFIPGYHKMVAMTKELEQKILDARAQFRMKISAEYPDAFFFYRKKEYIYSHTILNNIFFGRLKTENPSAFDKINQHIIQILIEEGVLEAIVEIGMQFQVGSKGDRLSGGQRQKLAIARVFLKNPRILIMDEATAALDNKSQARIQNILDTHWKKKSTLIAVAHRLDIVKSYDKIAVMKAGKIGEIGTYDELLAQRGLLYELVTGGR
jgi:ABC-type multidrug transport system fused ATPase/permease subunit